MGCFGTFSFRPQAVGAHTTTADLKTIVISFFEEMPAEAREPTALAKIVMPTGVACRAVALMRRRKVSLDILAVHR